MDFSRINKVGTLTEFLPVKKLCELKTDRDYKITNIKNVNTKWGSRITIDVENEFTCFLPSRFVKAFEEDEEMFRQMNASAQSGALLMQYLGTKYNNVQFKAAAQ